MFSTLSLLRHQKTFKNYFKTQARIFHKPKETPPGSSDAHAHQFGAHSPLQTSRHKVDELRSKIFFEHPPIPNRIAKFFILFSTILVFSTGVRDRTRKRHKNFVREQERKLFRLIVPFVQAMEDIRFTAIDQKNYMVYKAIADMKHPGYFENIRWRYHQEDI